MATAPSPFLGGSLSQSITGVGGSAQTRNALSQQQSSDVSSGASQSSNFSQTYIPDYQESPILRSVALQAQKMAPEVYQWGMQQYNNNQGNIDAMMRNAMTYASPQRIKASMGASEAGVMQGAEAGRQSALKDLQSFGIDPSSGRYGALDQASRVMAGAQAAGAGNIQRDRDIATGFGMQTAAQDASTKNVQTGYGAAGAANALLGTAMQLKYPPLGTTAGAQSTGSNARVAGSTTTSSDTGATDSYNYGYAPPNRLPQAQGPGMANVSYAGPTVRQTPHVAAGGPIYPGMQAGGSPADDDATTGGFVSQELSPSGGAQTDDVDARLNSGEFVIPKDVAQWKGQEFFYKLMAQARKMRATAGQESNGMGMQENNGGNGADQASQGPGYAWGGRVVDNPSDRTQRPMAGPGDGGGAMDRSAMYPLTGTVYAPQIRPPPNPYSDSMSEYETNTYPGPGYAGGGGVMSAPSGSMSESYSPMGGIAENYSPMGGIAERYSPMGGIAERYSPMGGIPENYSPMGGIAERYSPMGGIA